MKRDAKYYDREYRQKERSTHDIAAEHKTYPNKIRRELIRLGYLRRTKSEAQAVALKHGRHPHPTKGKPLSDEVRFKISHSMRKSNSDGTQEDAAGSVGRD